MQLVNKTLCKITGLKVFFCCSFVYVENWDILKLKFFCHRYYSYPMIQTSLQKPIVVVRCWRRSGLKKCLAEFIQFTSFKQYISCFGALFTRHSWLNLNLFELFREQMLVKELSFGLGTFLVQQKVRCEHKSYQADHSTIPNGQGARSISLMSDWLVFPCLMRKARNLAFQKLHQLHLYAAKAHVAR